MTWCYLVIASDRRESGNLTVLALRDCEACPEQWRGVALLAMTLAGGSLRAMTLPLMRLY
jgi:hypothetical protein